MEDLIKRYGAKAWGRSFAIENTTTVTSSMFKVSTVVIGTDTAQCLIVHVPRDLNIMHAHGDSLNRTRNFISLFELDSYIT